MSDNMVIELVLLTKEAVVMKSWMAAQYANVIMTLNLESEKHPYGNCVL